MLGTLANVTLEEALKSLGPRSLDGSWQHVAREMKRLEDRVALKPEFFWALRPEDVPDDMLGRPPVRYTPAYAHDPSSWLIQRHRDGHLSVTGLAEESKWTVEKAIQRPMGRPMSAPQIRRGEQDVRTERQQLQAHGLKISRLRAQSEARTEDSEVAKHLGYVPNLPRKQENGMS